MRRPGIRPAVRRATVALRDCMATRPAGFCFVTGSYRSGTTAITQWLGSNRGVTSFNETRIMIAANALADQVHRFRQLNKHEDRIARDLRHLVFGYYGQRGRYVSQKLLVDKDPLGPIELPDGDYRRFLANIRWLLPEAKIIMMVRDPIATIWSMSQRDYGYSLADQQLRTFGLDEHIENWCRATDLAIQVAGDSAIYVCPFERLTNDPAGETQRIEAFLEFDGLDVFRPRPTAKPNFSQEEYGRIVTQTRDYVAALATIFAPTSTSRVGTDS